MGFDVQWRKSVGVWQFKLLQPPTGSVIEHVRILFSKLEMRFNAGRRLLMHQVLASSQSAARSAEQNRKGFLWQVQARLLMYSM